MTLRKKITTAIAIILTAAIVLSAADRLLEPHLNVIFDVVVLAVVAVVLLAIYDRQRSPA